MGDETLIGCITQCQEERAIEYSELLARHMRLQERHAHLLGIARDLQREIEDAKTEPSSNVMLVASILYQAVQEEEKDLVLCSSGFEKEKHHTLITNDILERRKQRPWEAWLRAIERALAAEKRVAELEERLAAIQGDEE